MSGRAAAPMDPAAFAQATGVSRETLARLEAYAALLERWRTRVNLVSAASAADLWRRHMLDSAQLAPLIPKRTRRLVDLGSGAGFPGLVLAIMGVPGVELVESDGRKCAFLEAVIRETGAPAAVHCARAEALAPRPADVVTARALAPLPRLLALAARFVGPGTLCLFPKGARVDEELTAAAKEWTMDLERIPSATDPSGTILHIQNLQGLPRDAQRRPRS